MLCLWRDTQQAVKPQPYKIRALRRKGGSAPMACRSVLKLPVLLLIFSLLSMRWPLVRMPSGHLSSGSSAVWL